MSKFEITRDDIMDMEAYGKIRADSRRAVTQLKKLRRISVGPDATFYFENYRTMWHQVHEMLFIERGGEAQIADELSAYNPMIPNGRDLVATLMFEIDDEDRRAAFLGGLGGVEGMITLAVGDQVIQAVPEAEVERTTAQGKTSAIHFLHFPFSDQQIALMGQDGSRVVLGIEHPKYAHLAILPDDVRQTLFGDFKLT